MGAVKLLFIIQRPPYKSENSRLALTHAISSQTAEIYLDAGDSVVPTVALVGDGVLNAVRDQQSVKRYGITSTENHIRNSLLIDLSIWICREDMERLGLQEDRMITDAGDLGAGLKTKFVSFADIQKEMESAGHLLFF